MSRKHTIMLACLCLLPLCQAGAREKVEITPFTGYGFGGQFEETKSVSPYKKTKLDIAESGLYGVAVNWGITDQTQYEFYFSQQPTKLSSSSGSAGQTSLFDMDVRYFHVGGTLGFGDDKVMPFIAGGLGLTQFDPKSSNHGTDTNFSISIGGGVKLYLTENIGFRFEARGFGTLVNGNLWFSSGSNGGTIAVAGDGVFQGQLNAGLILAF